MDYGGGSGPSYGGSSGSMGSDYGGGVGGAGGTQPPAAVEDRKGGNNLIGNNPFANFPPPNFINPETRAPLVIGFNVSFVILALFVVVLRVWSRQLIIKHLNTEDWLIVVSWFLSFALSFWLCYATKFGMGRHLWDIPFDWFPMSAVCGYIFTALYNPTLMFIKASILLLYLRLSPHARFRLYCHITLGIVIAAGISVSFVLFFPCRPVQASWSFVPGSKCVNQPVVYLFGGSINTVTDGIILVLPMPILFKVALPRRQKIAVIFVFSLGIFVFLTSLARLVLVHFANKSTDPIWDGALVAMVSGVEVNVAIICASLPAIRPLIKRVFPTFFSTTQRSNSKPRDQGSQTPLKPHKRKESFPSIDSYYTEKPLPPTPRLPMLKHLRSGSWYARKSYGLSSHAYSGNLPPAQFTTSVVARADAMRSLGPDDFPMPPPAYYSGPPTPPHVGPGIAKKVEFRVDTRTRSFYEGEFANWQTRTV